MLRALILILLLANALFLASSLGWLGALSTSPQPAGSKAVDAARHSPIASDAVELLEANAWAAQTALSASEPAALPSEATEGEQALAGAWPASAPPPAAPVQAPEATPEPPPPQRCIAVGPFSAEQWATVQTALQSWPSDQWRVSEQSSPARWMVFWGGVEDDLVIDARRAELRSQAIAHERLRDSRVGQGFSLGRFSSEDAAEQQTRNMASRGINGAEVVLEREASTSYTLELPNFDAVREVFQSHLQRYVGTRSLQAC